MRESTPFLSVMRGMRRVLLLVSEEVLVVPNLNNLPGTEKADRDGTLLALIICVGGKMFFCIGDPVV